MKKFVFVLGTTLLAFGTITVSGCGESTPKTTDAQAFLNQRLLKETEESVGVVELRKTDGQKKTIRGVEGYTLYFEAKARVLHLRERCFTSTRISNPERFCGMTGPGRYITENKEGDEYPIRGHLIFEKRESGWFPVLGDSFSRGYEYKIVEE